MEGLGFRGGGDVAQTPIAADARCSTETAGDRRWAPKRRYALAGRSAEATRGGPGARLSAPPKLNVTASVSGVQSVKQQSRSTAGTVLGAVARGQLAGFLGA